jgi:ABC-type dipeptide/oligopeptide/nickel transport system permease component
MPPQGHPTAALLHLRLHAASDFFLCRALVPHYRGASLGAIPTFTWPFIKDDLWHSALTAVSLIVLGGAVNFQTMNSCAEHQAENFVQYAKGAASKEKPHRG